MSRAKAVVVRVEDRPGMLGEITAALSASGVNLRAVYGGNEGGQGVVRMVVDRLATAKRALAARGWHPEEQDVLEVSLRDTPGALADVTKRLGEAGVNIECIFVGVAGAHRATVYLTVSDIRAALKALRRAS